MATTTSTTATAPTSTTTEVTPSTTASFTLFSSTATAASQLRSRQSQDRARRRADQSSTALADMRNRNAAAMRQSRATATNNIRSEEQHLINLTRSGTAPTPQMLRLYEVDPYIAAMTFADGSGFNVNHTQLAGAGPTIPPEHPNIQPISPASHVRNVLEFQRHFRCDAAIVACASCGMTTLEDENVNVITLMSKEGSVFLVHVSHPLYQKYLNILNGEFSSDIKFFTVHLRQEPGQEMSFYHLHSDLLIDAVESTFFDDKLIHLCDECMRVCTRKNPVLPFFNPAHGYDFGKIPVVPGTDSYLYPFNLTLSEQLVCAKSIPQQTHIKFNATEEIGVQGHVVRAISTMTSQSSQPFVIMLTRLHSSMKVRKH